MHLIDPSWVVSLRSEAATAVFRLFPFLASDYFYIGVIALTFWLGGRNRPAFLNLGLLVLLSSLLNCTLKVLFRVPRPPSELRLIDVGDSFGFPSGDTQVGTVFFFYLFFVLKDYRLRWLCWVPIVGIPVSRVYLGVHSIYDVVTGLIVGLLTVLLWMRPAVQRRVNHWLEGRYLGFWILVALSIGIYVALASGTRWTGPSLMAIGGLVGCALSLPYIAEQLRQKQPPLTAARVFFALVALSVLVILMRLVPKTAVVGWGLYLSVIAKYALVIFAVCVGVPKLQTLFKNAA